MGTYTKQKRESGGRPVYRGGRDGNMCIWHVASAAKWMVGPESSVGQDEGSMYVVDEATSPDAIAAVWEVLEGYKEHPKVKVKSAGAGEVVVSGLDASHQTSGCMGMYRKTSQMEGGRAVWKGGVEKDMCMWHHEGTWLVGLEDWVGDDDGDMYVKDDAESPGSIRGVWEVSEGFVPTAGMRVERA